MKETLSLKLSTGRILECSAFKPFDGLKPVMVSYGGGGRGFSDLSDNRLSRDGP